jgi:hypothetical protein
MQEKMRISRFFGEEEEGGGGGRKGDRGIHTNGEERSTDRFVTGPDITDIRYLAEILAIVAWEELELDGILRGSGVGDDRASNERKEKNCDG